MTISFISRGLSRCGYKKAETSKETLNSVYSAEHPAWTTRLSNRTRYQFSTGPSYPSVLKISCWLLCHAEKCNFLGSSYCHSCLSPSAQQRANKIALTVNLSLQHVLRSEESSTSRRSGAKERIKSCLMSTNVKLRRLVLFLDRNYSKYYLLLKLPSCIRLLRVGSGFVATADWESDPKNVAGWRTGFSWFPAIFPSPVQ